MCVCVCVRERERELCWQGLWFIINYSYLEPPASHHFVNHGYWNLSLPVHMKQKKVMQYIAIILWWLAGRCCRAANHQVKRSDGQEAQIVEDHTAAAMDASYQVKVFSILILHKQAHWSDWEVQGEWHGLCWVCNFQLWGIHVDWEDLFNCWHDFGGLVQLERSMPCNQHRRYFLTTTPSYNCIIIPGCALMKTYLRRKW